MKELIIGCGSRIIKDLSFGNQEFENPVRLDINADHKPDIVWDLTVHPLPFKDKAIMSFSSKSSPNTIGY